ncbi:MAG: BatA domain-containing protein [bacterium]|nr:BatA domain-containing protein [bacterium]
MFSFLNSTVLFAAAAALIPLIIHLFSRRKVKVVEFSSLKHLKAMQRRQVRKLKIRQLLLLLLRMLIILLIVMAFARPTSEGGSLGSHASVSAVIVLDNTASMNRYVADGNLYELAVARVEKLLDSFGESDLVCLMPIISSGSSASPEFASAAAARKLLRETTVTAKSTNLGAVLESACELIGDDANLNKELYLVSDRQTNLLPDSNPLENCDARVYFLDLPLETIQNVGLTRIDFGGQLILPGHDFELSATVKNYSGSSFEHLIASLFIDGNRVSQVDFSIEADKETVVRFERSVSRTGFHSGYVEISDDPYMEDNRFYFSFRIPERFNLLIVGSDAASQLIKLALSPSADLNQYWSIKQVSAEELAGVNFFDYDVVFIPETPRISPTYLKRLEGFVLSGRALFMGLSALSDVDQVNNSWSALTGVTVTEPIKTAVSRAGFYSFQSFDASHPVFSIFELTQGELPEVHFYSLPKVTTDESARVLMRFTGNRAALVESQYGQGKVISFVGPISPEYSDLTSHAFFVPFVSRIAEYLASDLSTFDLDILTDDNIIRSVAVAGSIEAALEITQPDSATYRVVPMEQQGSLVINPSPTDQAGVYHVRYLGKEIDRFAANADPLEGDLHRLAVDDMATGLGLSESASIEYESDITEEVTEARFGREMWQLFLWLAALIIAVELILSRSTPVEE